MSLGWEGIQLLHIRMYGQCHDIHGVTEVA